MSVTAANILSSTSTSATYGADRAGDAQKAATKAGAAQATAQAANFASQLEKSLFGNKTLGLGSNNSNGSTDKEVGSLIDEMKSNSVSEKSDRVDSRRDDQAVNDDEGRRDDRDQDRAADDHQPVAADQTLLVQHTKGAEQNIGQQAVAQEAVVAAGPQQAQGQQQATQNTQQVMDVTTAPKGQTADAQMAQSQLAQAAKADAGDAAFDPTSMRAGLGAKMAAGVTPEGQAMAQQQQGQQGNAGQQQNNGAASKMTLAQNAINAMTGADKGVKGADFAATMQRNIQAAGGTPGIATKIAAQTAASQMAMTTATAGVASPDGAAPQSAFSLTNVTNATQQTSETQQPQAARHPQQPPVPAQQVAVKIAQAAADGARSISMQLDPADLGRVDIKLDIAADGKVTAVISAEKQDTLDLLQQDSKQLQKALESAGLTTDKDSFTFQRNDSQMAGGNLKGNQQGQTQGRQSNGQRAGAQEIEMMADIGDAIGAARTIALDGAVNIVI